MFTGSLFAHVVGAFEAVHARDVPVVQIMMISWITEDGRFIHR